MEDVDCVLDNRDECKDQQSGDWCCDNGTGPTLVMFVITSTVSTLEMLAIFVPSTGLLSELGVLFRQHFCFLTTLELYNDWHFIFNFCSHL